MIDPTLPSSRALASLRATEIAAGFTVIDSAPWLRADDWQAILASQDGNRVRLVLLDARKPFTGAFTRLIEGIARAGLLPVICEPTAPLIAWCQRHHYRPRRVGQGPFRHRIWHPRRAI